MAYLTPHRVGDYLTAACLRINHDFVLRAQRRSVKDKKELLKSTREIDLCARIADFFGPSAHLAAQGIGTTKGQDLEVDGPTIRAEVKYFRPPARNWADLHYDWDWLTGISNNNNEFSKRAWVVFWPSSSNDMFSFTNCLSVPKSHGTAYSLLDFAPFSPYTSVAMPANGQNQKLVFKDSPPQSSLIVLPQGKRIRCEIVGSVKHAIWAAVYTRATPTEAQGFPSNQTYTITDQAIPNP